MRFNKILVGLTATAAVFLTGCTLEPYVIPREEQYARDFIKTFGLIAPGHDWTAAQQADVTVNTAAPTTVKVYADYNGETYLFGKYDVEAGSTPLNFDIPKGATNYTLKANGRKLAFTSGQTVDLNSPASRDVNLGTHGSTPSVTITRLFGEHSYLTIDMDEMTSFNTKIDDDGVEVPGKLPESNNGDNYTVKKTNWAADGVTTNFKAIGQEFYLFPEYWNTGSYSDNIFGIYFEITKEDYDVNDTSHQKREVVEHIVDAEGNETTETKVYYLKTVPIFNGRISELKGANALDKESILDNVSNLYSIPEKFRTQIASALCVAYPNTYYKDSNGGYLFVREDKTIGYIIYDDQLPDYVKKDIATVYPDLFTWSVDKGILTFHGKVYEETINETDVAITEGKYDFYRSYGVKVEISEKTPFGFYINQKGNFMYSDSKLNAQIKIQDLDGKDKWMNCHYGATYLDGTDSEGNDKRYLLFEDWYTESSYTVNFDMNDLMFRAYGFDNYRPGIDRPTGIVDDIDDDTTDTPFPWIIACEDLGGTDDYDFNDIVFGVEHIAGEREVYVTALAAGGTLETHLYYGDQPIIGGPKKTEGYKDEEFGQYTADGSGNKFGEWHQWFGSNYVTSMINTESFKDPGATVVLVLKKSEVNNFTMSNTTKPSESIKNNSLGGFRLTVKQSDGDVSEIKAPLVNEDGIITGNIFPQMFATTGDYKWPTERTPIYSTHIGDTEQGEIKKITIKGKTYAVYPNSFHDWVLRGGSGFHSQKPTGDVINHGWKGFLKKSQSK